MRASGVGAAGRCAGDLIDAGGHDRDADHAVEAFVEGRADDDIGVVIDLFADAGCRLIDLVEREIAAAGDGNQQASRAFHRRVVDQRVGDRRLRGGERPLVAFGLAGAHHRFAHLAHDSAHIGEVEIDQAFLDHQVGDARDAGVEHLIGQREGIGEGRFLVRHAEQILVGNDEQRVDALMQFGDAAIGDAHAALAFEVERLGDDPDGEDAHFARRLGDDRRGAGAGAAAHAGGDEHHVRAGEMIADFVDHFFGGGAADLGLRARRRGLRSPARPSERCARPSTS